MMNKYWKLIAMALVVILRVGTFYIHSAISASQFPEFEIKTQSGDEQAISPVTLYAEYLSGHLYENLQITADGSFYDTEKSFFDRLIGDYPPVIEQLRKNHRNFMRGKNLYGSYYEDENYLAHGEITYRSKRFAPTDFKFAITILDKQNDKTNSFKIDIPIASNADFINLEDIQMLDDHLKLITNVSTWDGDNRGTEIRIFSVDMGEKAIVNDETILSGMEQGENSHVDIRMINPMNELQGHEYVVFDKMIMSEVQTGDTVAPENSDEVDVSVTRQQSNELFAYNLKTKEGITIPTEEIMELGELHSYDGNNIYFESRLERGVTVSTYSIEKQKVVDEVTVEMEGMDKNEEPPSIAIKNGKLYAYSHFIDIDSTAKVQVVDLKSGKIIYKGVIAGGDTGSDALAIHGIEIE